MSSAPSILSHSLSTILFCSALAVTPASASDVGGSWHGTLNAGTKLHLELHISKSPDGAYRGELVSIDQQNARVPIEKMEMVGRAIHFSLPSIRGVFDGFLDAAESRIQGEWTAQGGQPLPLSFVRSETADKPPHEYAFGLPFEARVAIAPIPFNASGKVTFAYELHLTNAGPDALQLQRIEAVAGETVLAVFEGTTLDKILQELGNRNGGNGTLDPGVRNIVRLWFSVPAGTPTPKALSHYISADGQVLRTSPIAISSAPPVAISPPLRGSDWKALNGPGPESGHWATIISTGGVVRFPDRFAIDWIRVGVDGRSFVGDAQENKHYLAYGQPVLAVADGIVSATTDNVPENVPGAHAVKITAATVCGNHVALDIGEGRIAFYCHLQPHSLGVKPGDHVKTGQVLGLVGNSGDSSEPHLHFQLADRDSLLESEGIPYAITSFELLSPEEPPQTRRNELPLWNQQVRFKE